MVYDRDETPMLTGFVKGKNETVPESDEEGDDLPQLEDARVMECKECVDSADVYSMDETYATPIGWLCKVCKCVYRIEEMSAVVENKRGKLRQTCKSCLPVYYANNGIVKK